METLQRPRRMHKSRCRANPPLRSKPKVPSLQGGLPIKIVEIRRRMKLADWVRARGQRGRPVGDDDGSAIR